MIINWLIEHSPILDVLKHVLRIIKEMTNQPKSEPIPKEVPTKTRRALGDIRKRRRSATQSQSSIGQYSQSSISTDEEEDTTLNLTGEIISSIVHAAFPNITKEIVIQELGFIERSIKIKCRMTSDSIATQQTPADSPNSIFFQSPDTRSEHSSSTPISDTLPTFIARSKVHFEDEDEALDPNSLLSGDTVELFFRKQLVMFLEQEITSEMIAMERLSATQNQALSWVRHLRGELRRSYVEMMGRRLDLEDASSIQLTESQIKVIFDAGE